MPTPPKQCVHTMNTIRLCFTATVVFLVVAIGGRIASCENNTVPFWKCCPFDRLYDPKVRYCRPFRTGVEEYRKRLVNRLEDGFRMAADARLNFTYNYPPYCNTTHVLVDVPAEEMHELMEVHPSPFELPPDYCFDLTPSDELVARTCRPRDQYCSGAASCEEYTVPFWKCCPSDQLYDPELRSCRLAWTDGDEHEQRLVNRLEDGFRVAANARLNIFNYIEYLYCNTTHVLVDVPAVEVRELMEANPSPIEFPRGYCFDLTPSHELVAQTCRPRDQYCGRPGYTCVNKCCGYGRMLVIDPNLKDWVPCKENEMPFTLSAYETNAGGSRVGLSNNTLLPIYGGLSCLNDGMISQIFMLTTDGKLHFDMLNGEWIVPETEYCVEYYSKNGAPEAAKLVTYVCSNATPPLVGLAFRVSFHASVVCLVLTLIVYATLPYLRNAHGYYVMFYIFCQLVCFVFTIIRFTVKHDLDSPWCIPFGYFYLFATLSTCCWLNVISFDIYWMLKYNNSTNRNTSKSVRTIMYHIYCWGFSSIFVSTGYLFQHSQSEKLWELAPYIGKYKCGFGNYHSYGVIIFYFLPICGTLTANFVLFILTAIHCSRFKPELNEFQQTDSKTHIFLVYKQRFIMGIKLFLVFEIPFLFSMLRDLFQIKKWPKIWIFIERIYFLQGVYILFIICFMVKRKVIMEIRKKFRRSSVQSEVIQLSNISGSL